MNDKLSAGTIRKIHGSVWIVTGSSRGIGRETARVLLEYGAFIVLHGRDSIVVNTTADSLQKDTNCLRSNIEICTGDISDPETASRLVDTARERFHRLDGIVLNAGLSMRGLFEETSPEVIRQICSVNLIGTSYCLQAALPELKQSRGRAVIVSSLAGIRGFPNTAVYSASRMALLALAESVSIETRHSGVNISLAALGFTENDPEKRIFNAAGQLVHHSRSSGSTQRQSALVILRAAFSKKLLHASTASGRLFLAANTLFPYLVGFLLRRSGGRIHGRKRTDQT
ncbi:SDR family NAD(P)-dependent oxidoreductase [Spirochaeta dissipatitropha]